MKIASTIRKKCVKIKSELSPLLSKSPSVDSSDGGGGSDTSFPILIDIIGARQLPLLNMEPYCVIQYGTKTIHRTKPFAPKESKKSKFSKALKINRLFGSGRKSWEDIIEKSLQNPIWSIQENSIFSINIKEKDLINNKQLIITIWARPRQIKFTQKAIDVIKTKQNKSINQIQFIGKIRISTPTLIQDCLSYDDKYRHEIQLIDELGNQITGYLPFSSDSTTTSTHGTSTTNTSSNGEKSMIAYRCRIASNADIAFVEHWNLKRRKIYKSLWKDADVIQPTDIPITAKLITELAESDVPGSTITRAVAGTITPNIQNRGKICIKPYPDPTLPITSQYMTSNMLKTTTKLPSRKWVQAGVPNNQQQPLGRIHLEILSAHNLPNVDYGGAVIAGKELGNLTDAFVAAVYGDSMVQTDKIDDELNPHWLPWTQRAFIFFIQHPSQVLYISVFGFKRSPLQHRPIGRIEINPVNFQHDTLYNLEYNLYQSSHMTQRYGQGTIRIRLRIEVDDERKKLLSSLIPPKPTYINMTKKKSLRVARYTVCGEYTDGEKFSLTVLQGYIDEILQGYLQRMLYTIQDTLKSLILWRNQTYIFENNSKIKKIGIPSYSIIMFILSMIAVEFPQLIPTIFFLTCSLIMFVQMHHRVKYPSPWKRCFSFRYYLYILLFGKSYTQYQSIDMNEGYIEQNILEQQIRKRIQHDKEFFEKKDQVEKEIEDVMNNVKVETKSEKIPVELLDVLGKVQGIVGDVCRLFRTIDAIIGWEYSEIAFFITFGLLTLGIICIFIPWAFVYKWLGRFVVLIILGPQNKLIDMFYFQNDYDIPDDFKLKTFFVKKMFEARCLQEDILKLKVFRNVLFGRYSTFVPSLFWTPHQDFPLPTSTAQKGATKFPKDYKLSDNKVRMLWVSGQQLQGNIIPRPKEAWKRNVDESNTIKDYVNETLPLILGEDKKYNQNDNDLLSKAFLQQINFNNNDDDMNVIEDEGFEVTELYDEEAGYVKDVLKPERLESIRELGVEVLDTDNENRRFLRAWRSVHDFQDDDDDDDDTHSSSSSSSSDDDDDDDESRRRDNEEKKNPFNNKSNDVIKSSTNDNSIYDMQEKPIRQQSIIEKGVEIVDEFKDEAKFAQQSWRGASLTNITKNNDSHSTDAEAASSSIMEAAGTVSHDDNDDYPKGIIKDNDDDRLVPIMREQSIIDAEDKEESPSSRNDPILKQVEDTDVHRLRHQSIVEPGFEIVNEFDTEAQFAQQSFRGLSSRSMQSMSELPEDDDDDILVVPNDEEELKNLHRNEVTSVFRDQPNDDDSSSTMKVATVPHSDTKQKLQRNEVWEGEDILKNLSMESLERSISNEEKNQHHGAEQIGKDKRVRVGKTVRRSRQSSSIDSTMNSIPEASTMDECDDEEKSPAQQQQQQQESSSAGKDVGKPIFVGDNDSITETDCDVQSKGKMYNASLSEIDGQKVTAEQKNDERSNELSSNSIQGEHAKLFSTQKNKTSSKNDTTAIELSHHHELISQNAEEETNTTALVQISEDKKQLSDTEELLVGIEKMQMSMSTLLQTLERHGEEDNSGRATTEESETSNEVWGRQSIVEPGLEITDEFDAEAQFAERSWKDTIDGLPVEGEVERNHETIDTGKIEAIKTKIPDEVSHVKPRTPLSESDRQTVDIEATESDISPLLQQSKQEEMSKSASTPKIDSHMQVLGRQSIVEAGFEIIDEFDAEAQFAQKSYSGFSSRNVPTEQSETSIETLGHQSVVEPGFEITDEFDTEAQFAQKSYSGFNLKEDKDDTEPKL